MIALRGQHVNCLLHALAEKLRFPGFTLSSQKKRPDCLVLGKNRGGRKVKRMNVIAAASVAAICLSISQVWAADGSTVDPGASPAPASSATPMQSGMPAHGAMPAGMQMPMMVCPMMSDGMMQMHVGMGPGMMGGMSDQNFVLMVIMHDQMMIQMARAELQHGKDEKVKATARSIISHYTAEIAQLRSLISAQ
jgi:hypothetical protein